MMDSTGLRRIDHARMAFELYRNVDGESGISDLIADLMHLADAIGPEDSDGPAVWARAEVQYVAEAPPVTSGNRPAEVTIFVALVNGETVGRASLAEAAAHLLNEPMEIHGFRFSELPDYRADLAKGHVLTAEDGTTFQVDVRVVQA